MTAITKLYLRIFLFGVLIYIILSMILDTLQGEALGPGIILKAAFWSAGVSLMLVSMHVLALRDLGVQRFDDLTLSVTQVRSIPNALSKETFVERMKHDPVFRKMRFTEHAGHIEIESRISWFSWGEKITAAFKDSDTGQKIIEVTSRPWLKATMVDFGRNKRNIDHIERVITYRS